MAKIIVDTDKCKGCLLCISFCPKGLIKKSAQLNKLGVNFVEFTGKSGCPPSPRLRRTTPRSFSKGGCLGCAMCAVICPDCCIEVWK